MTILTYIIIIWIHVLVCTFIYTIMLHIEESGIVHVCVCPLLHVQCTCIILHIHIEESGIIHVIVCVCPLIHVQCIILHIEESGIVHVIVSVCPLIRV